MALTRLPVQYRTYWPLKILGLPIQFHSEENMKVALKDKNSMRYRKFIRELRVVFGRDERLYNFVCESVPSDALEDIKSQISVGTAMRGARDVIDELFSEVHERGSLFVRRVSASLAPTTTTSHFSSRLRDRCCSQRRGCLVIKGKGMFAGVVRNAEQRHLCKGIDCRFSYEYIGEKADVLGYCLWCDSDKMRKAMECVFARSRIPKKGLQFFYDNDDDVFRMALTRLPEQYRTYWPLKVLGLPKQFHGEENMKAVCCMPSALSYASV